MSDEYDDSDLRDMISDLEDRLDNAFGLIDRLDLAAYGLVGRQVKFGKYNHNHGVIVAVLEDGKVEVRGASPKNVLLKKGEYTLTGHREFCEKWITWKNDLTVLSSTSTT